MPAQGNCKRCSKGMFNADVGQVLCKVCPSGKYSPEAELKKFTCELCPPGKYQDTDGSPDCRNCAYGQFGATVETKTSKCSGSCPNGTVCPAGSVENRQRKEIQRGEAPIGVVCVCTV